MCKNALLRYTCATAGFPTIGFKRLLQSKASNTQRHAARRAQILLQICAATGNASCGAACAGQACQACQACPACQACQALQLIVEVATLRGFQGT